MRPFTKNITLRLDEIITRRNIAFMASRILQSENPSRRWGHNTGNRASSLRGAPLERLSTVDQGAIRKMTGDRLTLERQKRFRAPPGEKPGLIGLVRRNDLTNPIRNTETRTWQKN